MYDGLKRIFEVDVTLVPQEKNGGFIIFKEIANLAISFY